MVKALIMLHKRQGTHEPVNLDMLRMIAGRQDGSLTLKKKVWKISDEWLVSPNARILGYLMSEDTLFNWRNVPLVILGDSLSLNYQYKKEPPSCPKTTSGSFESELHFSHRHCWWQVH